MRRAAKVDKTQNEIVGALRQWGCRVLILNGVVDLAVMRPGNFGAWQQVALVECKTGPKAKWTDAQQRLIDDGWPLVRLNSVDDAITWVQR